jgi:hypothetical protein
LSSLGLLGVSIHASASCGAAFCQVNTDWAQQQGAVMAGWHFDVRHEFIRQDQPLAGREKISVGEITAHHDEVETLNRNTLLGIRYAFNHNWSAALAVPYIDREHEHIHNHHGAQLLETWSFAEPGDMRLSARYQLQGSAREGGNSLQGWNLGLKLPTGRFEVENAAGAPAERSLQPGSGTTDLLLGYSYSRLLAGHDASWFVQGQWQAPLNERDDYRPGIRVSIDVGYRRPLGRVALLAQLNALYRGKDSGAAAEPDDSGGKALFLSPGASVALTPTLRLYGFVQLPLYQYVNGVQLTADQAYVLGLATDF